MTAVPVDFLRATRLADKYTYSFLVPSGFSFAHHVMDDGGDEERDWALDVGGS